MCLVAFAVTAAAQMLELLLTGNALLPMLRTAIIQTLWSMPMAAALYFPCRAMAGKRYRCDSVTAYPRRKETLHGK